MPSIAAPLFAILATLAAFAAPLRAQDPQRQVITGTLWVVEKDIRRLPIGGSLHICFDTPIEGDWIEVPLSSGAFRCELPSAATDLAIGQIRIEDRDAVCMWRGSLADASKPLELEARFVPESRVRVRVQGTGIELSECMRSDSNAGAGFVVQTLPYVVPVWEDVCPAFGWGPNLAVRVRAPGCAWASANVDLLAGGDFWIELVPEARLVVTVVLPRGMSPQSLSIIGPTGRDRHETLERSGQEFTFDGLLPGHYALETFSATAGTHRPLRQAEFDLSPGETRLLTLDLTPDPAKKRVQVTGTITVDPTWGLDFEAPRVRFVPLISEELGYGDGDYVGTQPLEVRQFSFDAGLLAVGKQFVAVEPFGWGAEIEVGESSKEIELCIAPKVHCTLRVVDAQTREVIDSEAIAWRAAPGGGRASADFKTVLRNDQTKRFEFDAPRGPIRFAISAAGYGWYDKIDQLQKDPSELTIALEPCCRIRVRLREGERTVLFPQASIPRAVRVDGSGEADMERMWSGDSITLSVSEPGTYSVSAPEIAGFLPPEPIVVEARRQAIVDVVFQLKR